MRRWWHERVLRHRVTVYEGAPAMDWDCRYVLDGTATLYSCICGTNWSVDDRRP